MSQSAEAADQVVNAVTNVSIRAIEGAAGLAGKGAINLLTWFTGFLKEQHRTKGMAGIKPFLGQNNIVFEMKAENLREFHKEAKEYGVLFHVVHPKDGSGICDVIVNDVDAAKVNRISDKFCLSAVDVTQIREAAMRQHAGTAPSEHAAYNDPTKERTDPPAEKAFSLSDNTLDQMLGNTPISNKPQKQQEDLQENPTMKARTKEKSSRFAPSFENKDGSDRDTIKTSRPSVRREIKDIQETRSSKNPSPHKQQQKSINRSNHPKKQKTKGGR